GAGQRVGAEPVDREARDREGLHPAGSPAGAATSCHQGEAVKRALFVVLCGIVPTSVVAKPGGAPPPPPKEGMGEASKAVTDEILDTIAEEMNRQFTQLEIPGAPKPYHIAYKITEVDVNDVAASLGQVTSRRNRHFVNLE